ncbi:hypothetical protein C8R43DRAFT_715047 [Mycena crocata]|nr:hypothetical protein C8R43DRAFT_715047 [Mycena crocata]
MSNNTDDEAARRIQRAWRARRREAADFLTTDVRLNDAKALATLTAAREAADAGHNSPQASSWRRNTGSSSLMGNTVMDLTSRQVGQRITGSSNKLYVYLSQWYHRRWQQADTTENFFKWLDKGEGKSLSLEECSREQLEREASRWRISETRQCI